MTREEYFTVLKNNIQSLSLDEQSEALQYYSDYFDDAGDDEKAMKDLGDPEKVAQEIREKFSNALVTEKETKSENTENKNSDGPCWDALYFEFAPKMVENLLFSCGAAEIVVIPGKKFSVETRGIPKETFVCNVDSNKTLTIMNTNKFMQFKFWGHSRVAPRILVSIPLDVKLNYMKMNLGAGKLICKDISLSYNKGSIEVGAGNLVLGNIYGLNSSIRCGMGNLEITGSLHGTSNIDCGMGSVRLTLNQDFNQCSYDAKIGLGSFKFNDIKKSGVSQINCNERKENHFSVNVGMGSVLITTK